MVSKDSLARDLFFGVDYHSHLGTEVVGLAFLDGDKVLFRDISNSQFKSEFIKDYNKIKGTLGIGVISDRAEEQPVKLKSKLGTFALCTVGIIRNAEELSAELIESGATLKKSSVSDNKTVLNQTEIVGELISRGKSIIDGIESMYRKIDGSISLLLLSQDDRSIYASGDVFPIILGKRGEDWAVTSETCAFPNLRYEPFKFLEYREIISINEKGVKTRIKTSEEKRFCPFLHVYYGFPASDYYGINAEIVRERCGGFLAENDEVEADLVLGIADSGFPHSVGYVKRRMEIMKEKVDAALEAFKQGKISTDEFETTISKAMETMPPIRRALVKYTPGWGRSYIPPTQEKRELIARFKQIPNPQLIKDKRIILVDDSIRRGTQLRDLLREQVWPYKPREVHGRIASPPQMFPCIFDLSTRSGDLATWKSITDTQGKEGNVEHYMDPGSLQYQTMVEGIGKMIGFTTLKFQTLENLVKAVIEAPNNMGLRKEDLCLYCWTGKI